MIGVIQQKQPQMPTSIVLISTCKHGGCMITIGKIPQKVKTFFRPMNNAVSAHVIAIIVAWFWPFVSAMAAPSNG